MKSPLYTLALLGLATAALGQTLAPSPTESVGCTPHGDHWFVPESTHVAVLSCLPIMLNTYVSQALRRAACDRCPGGDYHKHHRSCGCGCLYFVPCLWRGRP